MNIYETFREAALPAGFAWFNEPAQYQLGHGLELTTKPESDFWQRTHYGFQRDDGHCLLTAVTGDFALSTHVHFEPQTQYDQCGLMVRLDANNWIKLSTEYEDETLSRLGSVVTNLGYSDWATQDISSQQREMGYRISRHGPDFLLEHAVDGRSWSQLRLTHLHQPASTLQIGLYACSPMQRGFTCRFSWLAISSNQWGV